MAVLSEDLPSADEVLHFWFEELDPKDHFLKNPDLDGKIRGKFGALHHSLMNGSLDHFAVTPRDKLAAIIVLDQFSRNMFRDQPEAFASDDLALGLAMKLVDSGDHFNFSNEERTFLYMPFQHSEDLAIQDQSVRLFALLGQEDNHRYAIRHRDVIAQFGRFPHRNAALGRVSTADELKHIATPGTRF